MTPEKALRVIGNVEIGYNHNSISYVFEEEYNTIKKALKLLELYKEKDYPVGENYDERYQRYQEIIKQIKELEEELNDIRGIVG